MDETLRIRVDVETATLGQFKTALKQVREEMQTASREALPSLRAEAKALQDGIRNLSGSGESLTQTIRGARQEVRLMRFVLLEMTHALEGTVVAIGALAGASADGQKQMKEYSGAFTEALNAGLGFKLAIDLVAKE